MHYIFLGIYLLFYLELTNDKYKKNREYQKLFR